MLKRAFAIIILLSIILPKTTLADTPTPTPNGDSCNVTDCSSKLKQCKADCKQVIDKANKALSDYANLTAAQHTEIDDLTKALQDTQVQLDSDTKALDAWYRNPVILFLGGLIVGGVGAISLRH